MTRVCQRFLSNTEIVAESMRTQKELRFFRVFISTLGCHGRQEESLLEKLRGNSAVKLSIVFYAEVSLIASLRNDAHAVYARK